MKIKSVILKISIALVVVYFFFGLVLLLNQKSMLYYPNDQSFKNCDGFKDYQATDFGGTRFYLKENSSDTIIVYYHGNAGSACDRSYTKSTLEKSDASLIFVEYAGYSNDADNKPSRDLILKDVQNIHNYIQTKSYKNIIVYGQSIGSGAASYHASLGDVNNLILVTPFSRLDEVAQTKYIIYPTSILLTEKYDNVAWLSNYNGNLLIIHGDNDVVIPNKFSQKLYDKAPTKEKEYFLVEGSGHNDIWNSSVFRKKLVEYINEKSSRGL